MQSYRMIPAVLEKKWSYVILDVNISSCWLNISTLCSYLNDHDQHLIQEMTCTAGMLPRVHKMATDNQQHKGLLLWDNSVYCDALWKKSGENRSLLLFGLCTDQGYLFNVKVDHSYSVAFVETMLTEKTQSILPTATYRDSEHGALQIFSFRADQGYSVN